MTEDEKTDIDERARTAEKFVESAKAGRSEDVEIPDVDPEEVDEAFLVEKHGAVSVERASEGVPPGEDPRMDLDVEQKQEIIDRVNEVIEDGPLGNDFPSVGRTLGVADSLGASMVADDRLPRAELDDETVRQVMEEDYASGKEDPFAEDPDSEVQGVGDLDPDTDGREENGNTNDRGRFE